ncbi:MAG TPA: Gfo/Idh/MocA family oxidoreductase [Thermomicrobiales bacterium]|jgi:predicted dehydrogenase|nr:Gfo/Idh/MocA family oxidoreductase [Thermomicrobiales bacterium]
MTQVEKTVRVAILSFAHQHAFGYAGVLQRMPGVELVAIADDDAERGQAAAAQFGTQWAADFREVVARDDLDAVVICSENVRHKEMTIAAAEAGKHVLCEKPLATTVEDAQAMVDACAQHGVKLQTAFPVRFNAAVVALKQAVKDGRIGTPLAIAARNPGTLQEGWFVDPALSGGGAVIDHTVHVVDVLRWMFDAEVTEVYAEIDRRVSDIPTDDTGLLMMKLSNGIPVSLDTSWSRPKNWPTWGGVTIDIIGESGVLALDAYNNDLEIAEVRTPSYTRNAVEFTGDPEMVTAFIDAVRNDTEPLVTGVDGLRALQVALCAYESARRQAPVPVVTA